MTPEQWQRVSVALDHLLDLAGPERREYLQKLRTEDPVLYHEVTSLLEQEVSSGPLEAPPTSLLAEIQQTLPGGYTAPLSNGESALPRRAGRFVIRAEIARGGMGAVLRAFDPDIQRTLAIKILLSHIRIIPEAEQRFLREARLTGRLQHPGIPPIHELGRLDDGTPFFAMKLIEGQTLASMLGASVRATDSPKFIGIFEQICRTLAYAHNQGILHRDLKPSNVMVGAFGEVQVMDWGLAKEMRTDESRRPNENAAEPLPEITHAGQVSGTPAYMAPEQARGEGHQLDERCDVFGLGGILCAMLTGGPPFSDPTTEALRKSAAGDVAETFTRLDRTDADPVLIALAKKCLAPHKDERHRHAGEVADAVTQYREGVQEKLRSAELAREKALVQAAEERRRRRLTATLAGSLLLLVLGAAAAGLWYQQYASLREARVQNLTQTIQKALDDAQDERRRLNERLADPKQVNLLLSDLRPWRTHLATAQGHAREARRLAASDPAALGPDLLERLETLEKDLASDGQEEAFARQLDELRLRILDPGAVTRNLVDRVGFLAEEYAALFHANGLDVRTREPNEVAEEYQHSALRFVVAAALDDWAKVTIMRQGRDDDLVKRLLEISRRLDPDPWRDGFRQWRVWSSAAELEKATANLAPSRQPPQTIDTIALLRHHYRLDSRPLLRAAIASYPGDFWLNYRFGGIAFEWRAYDDSIPAYRAALALRPHTPEILNNLGIAVQEKGDLNTAAAWYTKALDGHPDFYPAHTNLGRMLLQRGQLDAAIGHFRQALARQPQVGIIHANLSAALIKRGDFAEALVHADLAVKNDPNLASAHNNRATTLAQLGNYSEALVAMKKANALQPEHDRVEWITFYERVLQLSKVEAQIPLPLETLKKGFAGRLGPESPYDLPFDEQSETTKSHRGSCLVRLQAGRTYQIDLTGDFDTFLRIEDERYNMILFNDDVRNPKVLHSRLIFTPQKDGLYRLVATSVKAGVQEPYELRVREAVPAGPPIVIRDKLTTSGKKDEQGKFVKGHLVKLEADQPYVVTLESADFDTRVVLVDAARKKGGVANTWMIPGNKRFSRVDWTPGHTEPYTVFAMAARPGATGAYTLTVQGYRLKK